MADKNVEVSLTDDTFTSEMGVHSTPISQIGEPSATKSVESNTVQLTPISIRYENKTDDLTAMMQLLLKIDSKCDKQNENFINFISEIKNEIKTQNVQTISKIKTDFNSKFEKIDEKFVTITDKILESVNKNFSTQIHLSLIHIYCF